MSTTRAANVQEQAHFRYLDLCGRLLRPHRGQTFIYEDGACHLFSGIPPDYMIARCKEYAECAECGIWRIGKRGDASRTESDIFAAMDRAYKCISAEDAIAISNDVSGLNVNIDGERRGAKRQRQWLKAEPNDAPVARACIDEEENVVDELALRTLDMWKTKESKIPATSRADSEALNCQEMIRKIMEQVVKGAIIPYYAEYLDGAGNAALGFRLIDACLLLSDDASRAEGTG